MATNTRVILYTEAEVQDSLGDIIATPEEWRTLCCEATYSGGSLRTFAGRLVGAGQVVLTTPWRRGIDRCRYAKVNDTLYRIEDVVLEYRSGQQPQAHIIITTVPYGD